MEEEYSEDDLPDNADVFESLEEAQEAADISGGTIYTQVDSEVDDGVVYVKGNRYVNRTGMYAVIVED